MTDEDYLREFFGEPISIYTDADALSDGTLVDISPLNLTFESLPVNRITGNLFWAVQPDYKMNDKQLEKLFADCDDDDEPVNFDHQAFALDFVQRLKQATGEGPEEAKKASDEIGRLLELVF